MRKKNVILVIIGWQHGVCGHRNLCRVVILISLIMIIFQSIQKYFSILGINSSALRKNQVFNIRNVLTVFLFGVLSVSTTEFLVFEATSFREYADSFYSACTISLVGANFAVLMWKTAKVFTFIEELQNIIQERRWILDPKIHILDKYQSKNKSKYSFIQWINIPNEFYRT